MTRPFLTIDPYDTIAVRIAERLIASRTGAAPLAPWNQDVIVASSGVSDAISRELLRRVPGGVAAIGLHGIETLARKVVNSAGEYPRIASDEERRLAMRTAARSLDDPLTTSRGAASMLERSYRDVRDSGLTVGEFARRVNAARSLRNRDRIGLIITAWRTYERLIAKLDAVDSADVLARAADLIASGSDVPLQILAGFYDMTGAQLMVVRALRSVDKLAAVYAPVATGFLGHLYDEEPVALTSAVPNPDRSTVLHQCRTREDEIRDTCARIARRLASGVAPSSIGVVCRALDPYDVALFERFSKGGGFSMTESPSTPLTGHRFGRTVLLLLRLRERNFPRSEVLEIVRGGLKLGTRLNADKVDYETRRASLAGGRSDDLRQRTFRSPVIADYIAAVSELESITERIDSNWLPKLIDHLRVETAADLAAIDELRTIATVFSRAEGWKRPFDVSALLDAIESATLHDRKSHDEPRPVIWLGDVMRLRGRSFDHLYAVRMQHELVPQRRVEDPLLMDSDRRIIGVREIGDGRAEEQLLFGLIRAAAKTVEFSYAMSDGFGKPMRRSNYLRGAEVVVATATDAAPGSAPSRNSAHARSLQMLVRSGTRGVFDGYLSRDMSAVLQLVSPTHLEDFGECPQKFLIKHILGVRDLEDPEMQMQINHREKGIVDHRILERFYSETGSTALQEAMAALPVLPATVIDALERIVDQQFDELEETLPAFNPPVRRIERHATRRVLRQFVAEDLAELSEEGLMPSQFEYKFGPFVLDVDGTSLRIQGKIDRIDEGGNRFRIIDYKSGKAARHHKLEEKTGRGVRLQLALYAMGVANAFEAEPSRVSAALKPIAGTFKATDFAFELAAIEPQLRETLAIFVAAIRRGEFPAFPNEKDGDYNACKYCPVNHSCRTRHHAEESRAVLRSKEPRTLLSEPAR